MIIRTVQTYMEKWMNKGKILIIYGARQVGKTTLSKNLLSQAGTNGRYINCELLENRDLFVAPTVAKLRSLLGGYKLVVLDEAQKVEHIGLLLKILHDELPEVQIIATGSASFDLADKVSEPLTGRAIEFMLYAFSTEELLQKYDKLELQSRLESMMTFGMYPDVFENNREQARERLNSIVSNYLYKDILEFEQIKKSRLLVELLQLLALQVGSEVSPYELGQRLSVSSATIERYLDLLEKAFVIFRLRSFSRNLRKEIGKSFKVYFFDLGVRNMIIANFNPFTIRPDVGALWENFCIVERLKHNANNRLLARMFFWRTYDQKEIDYVEEANGQIATFECKWQEQKVKAPREFLTTYPNSTFMVMHKGNWMQLNEGI
jgi:uncharacterized protein